MIRPGAKLRDARCAAVCAVTLTCALVSTGASAQESTAAPSSKSPSTHSTAAKTTSTSTHKQHSSTGSSVKKSSGKSTGKHSGKKSKRVRGQQKIDSERARSIQEALIREHYLSGEATGTWNQASEDAMRRYQADHGWQSKTVPDSRALITLGLGPSKDHLLNPESAMTTVPDPPKSDATTPTSHMSPATATPVPASSSGSATSAPPPSETASPQ